MLAMLTTGNGYMDNHFLFGFSLADDKFCT